MQAFVNLFNNGYNSGNTNFLGFGLGAQILARASRRVQASTSRRHIVGRLTGLDPAGLGPINGVTIGRLSSADAQFVESIHTEGSNRGDLESVGHVSYFVNGGIEQPMCNQVSPIQRWDCSHIFALTIWAESVRSPNPTFPAVFCDSWDLFLSGACNGNQVVNMGRATAFNLRGPHFLRTFSSPPFSSDNPWPNF
jgi:pancreatic triacylglycerol lipase